MPNETEDYNNFVRANLPAGMSYSANRYRYNNHSFYVFELAAWYYYYLLRVNSPSNLFSANEQGVWYDPSDLTTLFQDSAGTTPVTAAGQPVGLMLDKSKSLALGAELVTNGTFSSGTTGWTVSGTTLSVVGGRLAVTSASAGSVGVLVNNGAPYAVGLFDAIFDIEPPTGRTVSTYVRNASAPAYSTPQVGVTVRRQSTNTTEAISFFWSAAAAGEVLYLDNVSVRQILGNHATQATAAQRPTYGIHPYSGVRNVANGSADVGNNAVWLVSQTQSGVTMTKTASGFDTDGLPYVDVRYVGTSTGTNHDQAYAFNSGVFAGTSGQQATTSVIIRVIAGSISNVNGLQSRTSEEIAPSTFVGIALGAAVTASVDTISTATRTLATGNQFRATLSLTFNIASAIDVTYRIKGLQLELGSTRTAYQANYSQYNITEANVPSVHYIGFDGVDDGMVTSAIDFSATNKMTVFVGLRKLSDAARGMVVELGAALSTSSFQLNAPTSALTGYQFLSNGGTSAAATTALFPAPATSVITGLANTVSPVVTLRCNNVQVDTSSAAQGAGNYSNAILYIGRRGGTTLPFNGNIYSLIVRGAESTANQITSTETWVNLETGAY